MQTWMADIYLDIIRLVVLVVPRMNKMQSDVMEEQLRRTITAAIQFVNDPEHLPNTDTLENEIKVLKLLQEKLS